MFDQDYFTLRLVRLKSSEEWSSEKDGLYFIFPKGGAGQYVAGTNVQRLAPKDILVLDGNSGGKLSVAKGVEMVFWAFFLRPDHLIPLFAGNEISLLQSVVDGFKSSKLFFASTPLAIKCHKLIEEVSPQFNLDHRSQLLRVAAAILSEEFKMVHSQRIGSGQVEERILQVFERLSADQLLSLSVGELAEKFGCSRRHLNRLFHQYFSYSVAALKMEMRLQKAISLLRDVNAKVINVAEQCGFNHLGLFNTCFKKRFGVSPGEWRKKTAVSKTLPPAVPEDDLICPLRSKGLCPGVGVPDIPSAPKISPSQKSPVKKLLPSQLPESRAQFHASLA